MALLKPFAWSQFGQLFAPARRTDGVAGWAMLKRFWYSKPIIPGFTRVYNFHPAVDLGAPSGTAIKASEAGIVMAIGANPASSASGLRIRVKIRPGTYYGHGHCSGFPAGLRVGSRVARGQVIAYVGQTGSASGPHSHMYVETVVPNTAQVMLYDPLLFFDGGPNANDARIKPYY